MSRIIDYTEATSPVSDDYLVIDSSTNGTRKIKPGGLVDPTGTQPGMAADAKLMKDEVDGVKSEVGKKIDTVLYEQLVTLGSEVVPVSVNDNSTITILGGSTPYSNNKYGRYAVTQGKKYAIIGMDDAPQGLYAQYTINNLVTYISGSAVANDTTNLYKSIVFTALGSYVFISFGTLNSVKLYEVSDLTIISRIKKVTDDFPSSTAVITRNLDSSDFINGLVATDGTMDYTKTTRIATGYYSLIDVQKLTVSAGNGFQHRAVFFTDKLIYINTTEQKTWRSGEFNYSIHDNADFYRLCIRAEDDSEIQYNTDTATTVIQEKIYYAKEQNRLYGKKISILGDSLSTYAGINNYATSGTRAYSDGEYTYAGNGCRYPQKDLLSNVQDMYWMKLINHFNMTLLVNESIAGSTVISSDAESISNMTRIGHLGNNGTPDIILVNAGTNDIGRAVTIGTFNTDDPSNLTDAQVNALPVDTFANAYRTMIIRLQHYYPDSIVIVLLPNYTSTYYTPNEADEYNEVIKNICDYFGVFWIDTRTAGISMFNRETYLSDGIHYNSAGMELLYQNIKGKLEMQFA